MAEEIGVRIALPLVAGLIVGIIEAYFVYEDENMTSGRDFLKDMWHGLLFAVVGVLIASNVPWVMTNFIPESFHSLLIVDDNGNSVVASALITVIMFFKMVASHKVKGVSGRGFAEKPWHKLVVAALVGFAPYLLLVVGPFLKPVTSKLPEWIK